ncbi:MAG: glycosyltransferase family 2 protein [Thermodesulfobacteriota bacterium]
MLISVIMPVYNRAWSLERAIDSVLSQSFADFELLVVDDGSTDGSARIVQKYDDKRIRYFYQQHRGVSAARNSGLAVSRGRFIALLDSDDWWFPEKLERQVKFMLEGGWVLSQTNEIWIRKNKRVNPAVKHMKPSGWIFEPALDLCLISPSCSMFSSHIVKEFGYFREDLPACEDYEFWLRILTKYPAGLLPVSLVAKTGGHADQLSNSIIGLDLYRVYALVGLLERDITPEQRKSVLCVLKKKAEVYAVGCLKRDKPEEAERIQQMLSWIAGD